MSKPILADLRKTLGRHGIPHGAVEDANLPALLDAALERRTRFTTDAHDRNRDALVDAREALRSGNLARADIILRDAYNAEMGIAPAVTQALLDAMAARTAEDRRFLTETLLPLLDSTDP